MKGIIDVLQEEVKQAFEKAGYDGKYAKVTISNRPDLCQYQCNGALAMAKEYHKAPIQMAEQIVELLKQSDTFAAIAAQAPGFINMTVSGEFWQRILMRCVLQTSLVWNSRLRKRRS